ncbi:MAG: site-specific DNA-methyltransferase [Defluviitaleaceae bacterium]|nr:site-specific DNA-methyltransferase [Defluviitaleaceae bacterium]
MYTAIILKNSIKNINSRLADMYAKTAETGSLFALVSSEYSEDGDVTGDFLDVIEAGLSCGYEYVNTIIAPKKDKQIHSISDNVMYIVWFVKDKSKMYFNKDAIREKHIWKDVEWGKREKNYNPKGKDPGNVWIPTIDDGKGKITEHVFMDTREIINRLLDATRHGEVFVSAPYTFVAKESSAPASISENAQTGDCKGNIYFGTSEKMSKIKNGSVDVFITSPPYWDLKDYFKEGQIGKEPYDSYLQRINTVWAQCKKKLKPTGSLWINVNIRVRENTPYLLPKDIVTQCKKLGFRYKGIIIWHKSSGIPTHKNNIVDRHEYVLVFAAGEENRINHDVLSSFCDYKNADISGGALWNINRKAGSVGKKYIHPAIYPNELAERIILSCTNPHDTVGDPFVGSGTTLIAAVNNKRNFVGYEYYEGFKELMQHRFDNEINGIEINFAEGI